MTRFAYPQCIRRDLISGLVVIVIMGIIVFFSPKSWVLVPLPLIVFIAFPLLVWRNAFVRVTIDENGIRNTHGHHFCHGYGFLQHDTCPAGRSVPSFRQQHQGHQRQEVQYGITYPLPETEAESFGHIRMEPVPERIQLVQWKGERMGQVRTEDRPGSCHI